MVDAFIKYMSSVHVFEIMRRIILLGCCHLFWLRKGIYDYYNTYQQHLIHLIHVKCSTVVFILDRSNSLVKMIGDLPTWLERCLSQLGTCCCLGHFFRTLVTEQGHEIHNRQ